MDQERITSVSVNFFVRDTAFQKFIKDTYADDFCPEDISEMDCSNRGIESLEGLKIFRNLENLNCSGNRLTTIDVSFLTYLKSLDCSNNNIQNLDLRLLKNLENVDCRDNPIQSIQRPQNSLAIILCPDNKLNDGYLE